ncbi:MAG TPA: HAD hydrolase family protein [Candidatus Acidoferrales bacterium]|nr:HAD hydrolase family protein [Candidatus Acidoferrales bacterium]
MAEREISAGVRRRAKKIRLLLMDVDGVLTNGTVCLQAFPDGNVAELKVFNAHDGAGVKLASIVGLRSGMITGRNSPATAQRAHEMGVEFVFQGQARKTAAYEEILRRAGVKDEETAYIGDDLPDLPLLKRAGLAVAVGDAVIEVKRAAHYITRANGGGGAAREVVELILKAQGRWEASIPKALA